MLLGRIAAADPFVGTWKLRNSTKHIASETIAVDTTPTGYKWSYDLTLATGQQLTFALLIDTQTRSLTVLTAKGRTIAVGHYQVTGTNAWRIDAPNIKSAGSVAADGRTMTIHEIAPYDATVVFDKT